MSDFNGSIHWPAAAIGAHTLINKTVLEAQIWCMKPMIAIGLLVLIPRA